MNNLVSATQLVQWADRRNSQELLPALIRRLILASVDLSLMLKFEMPAGDSVYRPGVDGWLHVKEGTALVPQGQSVWEMGTDKIPKKKADRDYTTRTNCPGLVNPAETTFVFVTPRRWLDKNAWVEERKAEKVWLDVRAIDADNLELWLETCPAAVVMRWLCVMMHSLPPGMNDIQKVWEDFKSRTQPEMIPELMLAGRAEQANRVLEWIANPPSCLRVKANSTEEAIGFLAAVIESQNERDRDYYRSRTVKLSNSDVWRAIAGQQTPCIIAVDSTTIDSVASAVKHGHHVYVAYGNEASVVDAIILPHLRRSETETALIAMGVSWERARTVVREARGRIEAIIALLGGDTKVPSWAASANGSEMLPFLLIGSWTDTDHDAVTQLCRVNTLEVERTIGRWLNESNPPIRMVGGVYEWVSRKQSWRHLSRFMNPHILEAYRDLVLSVFEEIDPRIDLPADRRWMANLYDCVPSYSSSLRKGLVEGLAMLASDSSQAGYVEAMVRRIFGRNSDPRKWYSLADGLPTLAEAAPDILLELIERDVIDNPNVLAQICEQENAFGSGSGRFCYLLWALERMAWSPKYLSRVATILAALEDRISLPSNSGNRPERSLHEIFLTWRPHTLATVAQRLETVDAVACRYEKSAFQLCLKLVGNNHSVTSDTDMPKWRDWADGREPGVTEAERWEAIHGAFDRLLRWSQNDPIRLAKLLNPVPRVSDDRIEALVESFERLNSTTCNPEQGDVVRQSIRHMLHRKFNPFSQEQIERLEVVYHRLEPVDPIRNIAWLFARSPELLNSSDTDWRANQAAIYDARKVAISEAVQRHGNGIILQLVDAVESPADVGWATVNLNWSDDIAASVIVKSLDDDEKKHRDFADGVVGSHNHRHGWPWVERICLSTSVREASDDVIGRFAMSLPADSRSWDWIEQQNSTISTFYWRNCHMHGFVDPATDGSRGIRSLIRANRPFTALQIASMFTPEHQIDPKLLIEVLDAVTDAATGTTPSDEVDRIQSGISHEIGTLLDIVDIPGFADENWLLKIEWTWSSALEQTQHGTPRLRNAFAQNPRLFADAVGIIYKTDHEPDPDANVLPPNEFTRERTTQCWRFLEEWRGMPGLQTDGTIHADELSNWVTNARELLQASGHSAIGDECIGQVLSRSPIGQDGNWPHEDIRQMIERIHSTELEEGVMTGKLNGRGGTCRPSDAGGELEVALAENFGKWAESLASSWPRTSRILRQLQDNYSRDAHWHDARRDMNEF